jgi:hypothetical protein
MNNAIGKLLILINLIGSVVLLSWASVLFLRPVDWGWEEPGKVWGKSPEGKKEPNERIASKIDERLAGYAKLREVRRMAVAGVAPAEARLSELEGKFGHNHLVYEAELERLLWGEGKKDEKISIVEIAYNKEDGTPVLQNPVWGVPDLTKGTLVADVNKPYVAYLAERDAKAKEILAALERVKKIQLKHGQLTLGLIGKDGKPGLYALRERESEDQRRLEEELEHLRPVWVTHLYNAQLLRGRRERLEKQVIELGGDPSSVRLSLK